jgi:hypothetical protein
MQRTKMSDPFATVQRDRTPRHREHAMSTFELTSVSSHPSDRRVQRRNAVPRRGVAVVETVALVVLLVLLIAGILTTSRHDDATPHTTRIFANGGDTPWSIAATHPVPGHTTEQLAEEITRRNGVNGSLTANTAIVIPAPAAEPALACR